MNYYINPSVFSSVFTVPSVVVDRHLKLAKAEHIKVLLFILKNMSAEVSEQDIAEASGISEYEVKEALLYWADAGVLNPKEELSLPKAEETKAVTQSIKPSRADVAKRGLEDPKIQFMLSQTQIKLGRALKSNEAKTLVWLYDDHGLDVSVILYIVQLAIEQGKPNIRFIESVAVDWINKGIDNIIDADAEVRRTAVSEQAWRVVCDAFGIEKRKPSKKETEYSLLWIEDWKLSKELLNAAYEECVNQKSKFSFAYVAKIVESWNDKGYKTVEDLNSQRSKDNGDSATNDIELFKKMLNSKD